MEVKKTFHSRTRSGLVKRGRFRIICPMIHPGCLRLSDSNMITEISIMMATFYRFRGVHFRRDFRFRDQ